ncbi:MAG: hypothetical protein EOM17_05145, partial [Synergistales bacterium]|nr:hypothetical protein [Synergistales bacterium]
MDGRKTRKITMPCMIGTSFTSHFDFGQRERPRDERIASIKEFNTLTSDEKKNFLSEHLIGKSAGVWNRILGNKIED